MDRSKITEYLLCPTHPDGRGKALFFASFGFTVARWEELAEALRQHGRTQPVVRRVDSRHGIRYTVEGPLAAPDGRRPRVRTIWIDEKGATAPRLVTAFPA